MSNAQMTLAWECPQTLNQGELLVLVKLADNANDDGTGCFPSQSTIARAVRLKRESVSRICRRLKEKGLVEIHHRAGRSNQYTLRLTCDGKSQVGCDEESQVTCDGKSQGCDSRVTPPVTPGSHITQREPSPNRKDTPAEAGEGNASGDPHATDGAVPYRKILDLYHEILCPPLRQVVKLTPARRQQIRARWNAELPSLDRWRDYFETVRVSDFLMGRLQDSGMCRTRPWQADIDWLTRQGNVVKVAEGKYD